EAPRSTSASGGGPTAPGAAGGAVSPASGSAPARAGGGGGDGPVAVFVAPYLLPATTRFVTAAATLPDVRVALVTAEPADRLPPVLRRSADDHWRVDDPTDPRQLATAVE